MQSLGLADSVSPGIYDARRIRTQREIIRDVMLSAASAGEWVTLRELAALTRFNDASISAQLRHLRKLENGGFKVLRRIRKNAGLAKASMDGRGQRVWEYQISV